MSHQPHGKSTELAPRMRRNPMSKGNKLCDADALAITIKEVHMSTVVTAAMSPTVRGEKFIAR